MKIDIRQAVETLSHEQIVALPTETVYGLAARYDSAKAIERIFATKQRPMDNPLIVHVPDTSWITRLATDVPKYVQRLVEQFWPGPLTVVLTKTSEVRPLITGGQQTVALRMPDHPVFLSVLEQVGVPLVAPSANVFCQTSPTTAEHVLDNFNHRVPVVDGGACQVGIESTIVLATHNDHIQVLRQGIIPQEWIAQTAGLPVLQTKTTTQMPGHYHKHYSPSKVIRLCTQAEIAEKLTNTTQKYLLMVLEPIEAEGHLINPMPNDPKSYAKVLYATWKQAEKENIDEIIMQMPPQTSEWGGIWDRILKASKTQ